jgi:indoleamine 2,3-dioxygenase
MIPIPRLSDYDVSALHGFLPTDPPCDRLADPYYQPWEDVIFSLHTLTLTKRIRSTIDRLPVLSTKYLRNLAEWRRAYSILGFMVHSYVWGGYTPADVSDLKCVSRIPLPPGSKKSY